MEKGDAEYAVEFPSVNAAWHFSADANESGWKTYFEEADVASISPPGPLAAIVIGPVLGGSIFGLVGWFSEAGSISLPRLEPLFASPYGTVTLLFAALGVSFGLLVSFFAVVKPVPSRKYAKTAQIIASGEGNSGELQSLAWRYGGNVLGAAQHVKGSVVPNIHPEKISKNHEEYKRR